MHPSLLLCMSGPDSERKPQLLRWHVSWKISQDWEDTPTCKYWYRTWLMIALRMRENTDLTSSTRPSTQETNLKYSEASHLDERFFEEFIISLSPTCCPQILLIRIKNVGWKCPLSRWKHPSELSKVVLRANLSRHIVCETYVWWNDALFREHTRIEGTRSI